MKELKEGEVGFAKSSEELKYPDVTSCLTFTCVAGDGGKWGAHMSIKQRGKGLPHHVILQTLRTEMSSAKAIAKVKNVLVVGALGFWTPQLKPRVEQQKGITEQNRSETAKLLVSLLGLNHLDTGSIGNVPGGTQFVFMNWLSGCVVVEAGSAAKDIGIELPY